MATTIALWGPTGLTLTLKLYSSTGGDLINTGGDDLTEGSPNGYYTASVDEALTVGSTLQAEIYDATGKVAGGSVYIGSGSGPFVVGVSEPVTVKGFTTAAKAELAGMVVVLNGQAWDGAKFTKAFVRGDSYRNGLEIPIRITGWAGLPLDEASIVLTATHERTGEQFTWDLSAAQIDATTWDIDVSLTSADTDQATGVYKYKIVATWASETPADAVTLSGPEDRLRIISL